MSWKSYSYERKCAILSIAIWFIFILIYLFIGWNFYLKNNEMGGLALVMFFLILGLLLIPSWLLGLYAGTLAKKKNSKFWGMFFYSLMADIVLAIILLIVIKMW